MRQKTVHFRACWFVLFLDPTTLPPARSHGQMHLARVYFQHPIATTITLQLGRVRDVSPVSPCAGMQRPMNLTLSLLLYSLRTSICHYYFCSYLSCLPSSNLRLFLLIF
ncbi:hypothetical protein NP493_1330g01010 [Ridgeia piscesae]|uniref:Secreted protein n=1 Tax=Ridgeia piscesae TaxID=27915 RepID=A0AAD9K8Y8_RIDPI|nr:hypothetical protein NP493_1330g01010 [Ridgeia piscesae]